MIQIENALNTINKKIIATIVSLCLCMFFIFLRLVHLQIICKDTFCEKSTKNFTRIKVVQPPRGNITDCNGKLLATNRPLINVSWDGSGNKKLSESQIFNINKICEILSLDVNEVYEKVLNAEKGSQKIILSKDIQFEALSKVSELFANDKNIKLVNSFIRYYPHQEVACHMLGYLSQENIDYIGKTGLEYILENLLKGKNGKVLSKINSRGKKISEEEIEKSDSGEQIKTCIDIEIQKIIESSFPENESGSIVIMDPIEGDIKAILSRPGFNPNTFLQAICYDEWQRLQENKVFINRACNAAYPPASMFKLVTLTAALEEKIIDENTITNCTGHINFVNRDYHCHKRTGHGPLTVEEAFAKSCNILFYKIGKKIHIDTLAFYANQYGLGENTGIIFPEKSGLIPTNRWKVDKFKEKWWQGETLSAVIGQSFNLVTPIQMARMISSFFTGYLVKPRILKAEEPCMIDISISKKTLKFMRKLLKQVVQSGTGQRTKVKDFKIYAKTGTAQTSAFEKRTLGKEFLEHAWFLSYFKYKDKDPLVMVIMVENVGSTAIALSTAKKILLGYKNLIAQSS